MIATVWFTGLSGSGKTTVSSLVVEYLRRYPTKVEHLDGDAVRENLSKGLGFSKEDRDTNVRRIGWVCSLLNRNGVWACASAISPYDDVRKEVLASLENSLLVYCYAPLDILEKRDVKGLYAKARQGLLPNLTGVSDPYEIPSDPDVEICSDGNESPCSSALRVIQALRNKGFLCAN